MPRETKSAGSTGTKADFQTKRLASPPLASLFHHERKPTLALSASSVNVGDALWPAPAAAWSKRRCYRNFSSRHLTASRGPSSSKRRFHSAAARPE